MSLRHIMLGMLREPNSGYDLKKGFDRSLRNFWRAELSQIYPLLQKMDDKGLLTSKEDPSSVGPTRRVYTRTTKGRKELMSWLSGGPTVGTERIANREWCDQSIRRIRSRQSHRHRHDHARNS